MLLLPSLWYQELLGQLRNKPSITHEGNNTIGLRARVRARRFLATCYKGEARLELLDVWVVYLYCSSNPQNVS